MLIALVDRAGFSSTVVLVFGNAVIKLRFIASLRDVSELGYGSVVWMITNTGKVRSYHEKGECQGLYTSVYRFDCGVDGWMAWCCSQAA